MFERGVEEVLKVFGFNKNAEKSRRKGNNVRDFLNNPDPKYRFDSATFRISINTDIEAFKARVAEYFVISNPA